MGISTAAAAATATAAAVEVDVLDSGGRATAEPAMVATMYHRLGRGHTRPDAARQCAQRGRRPPQGSKDSKIGVEVPSVQHGVARETLTCLRWGQDEQSRGRDTPVQARAACTQSPTDTAQVQNMSAPQQTPKTDKRVELGPSVGTTQSDPVKDLDCPGQGWQRHSCPAGSGKEKVVAGKETVGGYKRTTGPRVSSRRSCGKTLQRTRQSVECATADR